MGRTWRMLLIAAIVSLQAAGTPPARAQTPADIIARYELAKQLHADGRYAEAEAAYKHTLAQAEQALGPTHPQVAMSLSGLAAVYLSQGRQEEAEVLLRRARALGGKQ